MPSVEPYDLPRRLLVVEDDRAIADAVVRRLRSEGYAVDAVHDGLAAVAAAARVRYDAVVLDVMLPGLDGLEVCRRIQEAEPVPVLMLTARDDEADRLVGLAVGADDYLTKPFSPRELVARIAALQARGRTHPDRPRGGIRPGGGSVTPLRADLRPLDPVRSIKAKLGLVVGASVMAAASLTWLGLVISGWRTRYGLTVAVLVALVVSQVLARGMTSPLRQMTAAAREMAAGRSPGPIRSSSRDEVGELARAFTAMSRDLATADAQRRDLLANLAHELRTPVAAVRARMPPGTPPRVGASTSAAALTAAAGWCSR